jgi:hypothetical protein
MASAWFWPAALSAGVLAAYGPFNHRAQQFAVHAQATCTNGYVRVQRHLSEHGWGGSRRSSRIKWLSVAFAVFLSCFVLYEVYFQVYECKVSDRYAGYVTAMEIIGSFLCETR